MSKGYSYNKRKLKKRQGKAIYGLLGQQLGGLGGVLLGGTKGNILGRYAVGSVAGMGTGYLAGAHLPVGGDRQLDYTVERAIKHYKKTGKKNAVFRDLEKNYNLKLSKHAALENFYMVKHAHLYDYSRDEAYYNYLLVKEGAWLKTFKQGVTNIANKATLHMGNYRTAPGPAGTKLGKSFDAGASAGNQQALMQSNRALAKNQLLHNPFVRKQALTDVKMRGMGLLTKAQVGEGNWALARQLGSQIIL